LVKRMGSKKLARSMRLFTLIFFIFLQGLFAEHIVRNDEIILEKTYKRIESISRELKEKTGVHVAVAARRKSDEPFATFEEKLKSTLTEPYALVTFSAEDTKINITIAIPGSKLNPERIRDDYVIPILVEKRSDLKPEVRYSAALLNGTTRLVMLIAQEKGEKLSTIGELPDASPSDFLPIIGRGLLFLTIIAAFLLIFRYRQKKVQ